MNQHVADIGHNGGPRLLQPGDNVLWAPQAGPQARLITCPVADAMFGGARGGGKTDGMLGEWMIHANTYGKHANGIMFRRTLVALEETIERARELFEPLGAKYNVQQKSFKFANGARIKFRFLDRDEDAQKYQGHSYCVGVGTPVLMADGSWRPIDRISVGESVMTMQGPRRVLHAVKPYMAPCVTASVFWRGNLVARQLQPIWHPLSAIVEGTSSRSRGKPDTARQCLPSKPDQQSASARSRPYADPKTPDWLSWSADGRSDCKAFEDALEVSAPPQARSFLARLHEPSFRSTVERASFSGATTRYQDFQQAALSVLSRLSQALPLARQVGRQFFSRALSDQGSADLCFANGRAYAANEKQPIQGFQGNCRFVDGSCGELAPFPSGIAPSEFPSPCDVVGKHHSLPLDASDTIPTHTRQTLQQMGHPYTGEALDLSEPAIAAHCELSPYGYALVTDLQIEGNNHYITYGGLINKNTRVYVEELTQFPNPEPIMKLMATLRSAHGVPCAFRATANPGGPGHLWVKRRYVDPWPAGNRVLREYEPQSGLWMERIFIPSRVQDNRLLAINDPFYVARLAQSGSEQLVKAWLDGDWTIIEGAFFDCFAEKRHVVAPHEIPKAWTRIRGFDWGSSSPFACLWFAVSDGYPVQLKDRPPEQWPHYPKNALICYREWYGSPNNSNTGLKMTNFEIGKGIATRTPAREKIHKTVCDPSIFKSDGGPSIAEQMWKGGKFMMSRADNSRIPGWGQVRSRLLGDEAGDWAGRPMLYFFSTCVNTIRTLPVQQHDNVNAEDIDTDGEDHCADVVRYVCQARPYARKLALGPDNLPYGHIPTLAQVIAHEQGVGGHNPLRSDSRG